MMKAKQLLISIGLVMILGLFVTASNLEEAIEVEQWMTQPFMNEESVLNEDTLEVEAWMTRPFETINNA